MTTRSVYTAYVVLGVLSLLLVLLVAIGGSPVAELLALMELASFGCIATILHRLIDRIERDDQRDEDKS